MNRLIPILALSLCLFPSVAAAETPEEKGLAIAQEADRREAGYGDFTADLLMVLKNKHGEESERTIRIRTLEVEGDGDKSLSIFCLLYTSPSPRD